MTTSYPFDIGFSDQNNQLDPPQYANKYASLAALQPKLWRLTVPWSHVVTAAAPGAYPAKASRAQVTATARGSGMVGNSRTNSSLTVAASASGTGRVGSAPASEVGRDWSSVDNAICEVKLRTGADVILVIGQAKPVGWTNASYQSFCAEVARRYRPGGPGIRTDGEYAALTGWGVTSYEVWNEQNNQAFWGSPVSAKDYTALLAAGYAGIKSVLPGGASTLIFGGMQHVQFTGPWYNPFLGGGYGTVALDEYTFLQECYSYGAHGNFDAMATHVYPAKELAETGSTIGGVVMPGPVGNGQALKVTATATGAGQVNLANPSRNGRLQVAATALGSGMVNQYEPPGPVPSLAMDNFRQVQAIYGLMVANGDAAKGIHITELGYCVYTTGLTPALQKTYVQACFDLLATLPYIDSVYIYNAVDANNGTTDDGYTGYGVLDYSGKPRPIYDWLRTLTPPISGGGGAVITATATGAGSIGGAGALTVAATALGSGGIGGTGGVITATATGSGFVGASGAAVVTATALGAGSLASSVGGGLAVAATALGAGQVTAIPVPVGGTGVVGVVGQGSLTVTASAYAGPPPVGGSLMVTTAAAGAGRVDVVGSGSLPVTATAAGAGPVGRVGSGALSVAATAASTSAFVASGSGALAVTASRAGAGVVAISGAGSQTVTATATGAGAVVVAGNGTGTQTVTAAALGAGVVGISGAGSSTVTAAAAGAGLVGAVGSGASTVTAAATGAGVVGISQAGSQTVTAAATGAGQVGLSGSGSSTITATRTGAGAPSLPPGSGSSTITATATGAGMLVKNFWVGVAPQFTGIGVGYESIVSNAAIPGNATEGYQQVPLSDACTVTSITAWVTNAPGAGNSWTFTLRSNNADTSAAVTISGAGVTTATWNGSVSLSQQDLIAMKTAGAGSPASSGLVYWAITYSCTAGQLLPATNFLNANVASGTLYNPPAGGTNATPVGTATTMEVLIPTGCTVARIAVLDTVNGVPTGPGSGNTNTYTVVNNTTATTSAFNAAIVGTATKAVSGSGAALSFSAGDRMIVKEVKGPASAWGGVATCMTIVPTVPGEQIVPFGNLAAPSTTVTNFETPNGYGNNGWNATESAVQFRVPACTIKKLYTSLVTAPGAGKSRTFKVRSNNADTAVSALVSNTNTTANDTTNSATHAAGNFMSVESLATSTPAATAGVKLGFVLVPT